MVGIDILTIDLVRYFTPLDAITESVRGGAIEVRSRNGDERGWIGVAPASYAGPPRHAIELPLGEFGLEAIAYWDRRGELVARTLPIVVTGLVAVAWLGSVLAWVVAGTRRSGVALVQREARLADELRDQVVAPGEANRRLDRLAANRNVLLREIEHRVRNNLSVMRSLLTLQISQTESYEGKSALEIAVATYLRALAENLETLLEGLSICVSGDTSRCDLATVPVDSLSVVGLFLNKLVMNIAKHRVDTCAIAIGFTAHPAQVEIRLSHNPAAAACSGLEIIAQLTFASDIDMCSDHSQIGTHVSLHVPTVYSPTGGV